jgi:acyl carrier protein
MVDRDEIDLDKSMIDDGIIDSFGLIEIATFMEKEFEMKVGEEKMIRDNFGSVNKIVAFIERETRL